MKQSYSRLELSYFHPTFSVDLPYQDVTGYDIRAQNLFDSNSYSDQYTCCKAIGPKQGNLVTYFDRYLDIISTEINEVMIFHWWFVWPIGLYKQGPLLLTWFNFNPSMDK